MKLQVAIATALATEGLADSSFPVQTKTTVLSKTAMNRMKTRIWLRATRRTVCPKRFLGGGSNRWMRQSRSSAATAARDLNPVSRPSTSVFLVRCPQLDKATITITAGCKSLIFATPRWRNREQIFDFATKPTSVNTDKFCEAVIQKYGPEACNECGSTAYIDPVTGMETGAYSLKVDCPGLIGKTKCKTCVEKLQPLCQEKETCPGCGPLCGTCNSNGNDWFIDNQNCMRTYDMRVANEIEQGTPVDLEEAVDFILYDQGMLEMYLGVCEGETLVSIWGEGTFEDPDGSTEEEDASGVASSSVSHSPIPTILRFALVGASWLWMAT